VEIRVYSNSTLLGTAKRAVDAIALTRDVYSGSVGYEIELPPTVVLHGMVDEWDSPNRHEEMQAMHALVTLAARGAFLHLIADTEHQARLRSGE